MDDRTKEARARRLAQQIGCRLTMSRRRPEEHSDRRFTLLNRHGGFEMEWADIDWALEDLEANAAVRRGA